MDTTRGDRCSLNGFERPTTPRLEALAREGVTFRDAWSPAGWTAPAHASLFTGLRPERHRCLISGGSVLADRFDTLAELLADAGYETGCFSHNAYVSERFGLTQGFGTEEPLWRRKELKARAGHEVAATWALGEHEKGERFFLFVNDMEPHLPYSPARRFAAEFVPAGTPPSVVEDARGFEPLDAMRYMLGRLAISDRKLSLLRDLYDAEIRELDHEVGSLVERLREGGVLDETLVVITSDHGENIGDHGMANHKSSLHRSVRHVPLLVRYPGVYDGGRVVDDVVRLEDVFPTILDLCGVATPAGIHGESLLEGLAGRLSRGYHGKPDRSLVLKIRGRHPGADTTPIEHSIQAVYDGHHHFIRYSSGKEELYDVRADPAEERDLAGRGLPAVERMRKLLE
jgi:arylsulfatase A-like enzyme